MVAIRQHPRRARRGAILLVVLAMLALFAVIALSFVLYAESEATSMRNARAARNGEADPNPQEAANVFLAQMLFGASDSTSAINGHDFATTKFGWNGAGQNLSPFSGSGLPQEDVSALVGLPANSLDRRSVVNYTNNSSGQSITPNMMANGTTPINKSTGYTYPDRANYYLALMNPQTGEIVQPSFHRPDLFDPTNNSLGSLFPGNANWTSATGRYLTVRPRPAENPNFPLVPANPDGTYTGDVQNMKFTSPTTGSQKNDSIWMYAGAPVKSWRGKLYTACIAPLILDLNGRINLSVAGNNRNAGAHASNQGFGAWEVNPTAVGISATDLQSLLALRYTGSTTAGAGAVAPGNRYLTSPTNTNGTINGGVVPPQYSRLDPNGAPGTMGTDGPMSLPTAGNYNPFLVFTSRFAPDQASYLTLGSPATGELANHPQTFNPFHWPRGVQSPVAAHAFGLNDQIPLTARYSDPKNRSANTELGTNAATSFAGTTATAQQNRALTTLFNVTQTWAEVPIATGAGTYAKLGPIDLNRKLADYRTISTNPYTPSNIDPTNANYLAARQARQFLAMDIFLRLAALAGLVDGTNVIYNYSTHCLNSILPTAPNFAQLQKLAQYAVNMVDAIDSDDIQTAFVWNPINPVAYPADPGDATNFPANSAATELGNRVVYGTELPRLVINEAYCKLDNDRSESKDAMNSPPPVPPLMKKPAQKTLQKKYWIELRNPLPVEPATSMVSELGAARLQYVNGTSTGATSTYAVYQVEVEETTATSPLYSHLTQTPTNVLGDPSQVGATLVNKLRISNYTYGATTPAATLTGDELNLVRQTGSTSGVAGSGGNQGYYLLSPIDAHPSDPTFTNLKPSMALADPPAMAAAPQNALWYDTTLSPSDQNIGTAKGTTSTIVLRRLANPYLPPQTTPANPNYNPYITVDFVENIPTRDRVEFNDKDDRSAGNAGFTLDTGASIGKRHPYSTFPAYVDASADSNQVVQQKLPAATTTSPPHTFFSPNSRVDPANAGQYIIDPGPLAVLMHFDRELINSSELLQVSVQPPHLLTGTFSDGTVYQRHNGSSTTSMGALMPFSTFPSGVANPASQLYKAFDLLTTANRLPGIPLGGREPGKVNLNTVSDSRVLQALFDPQTGNRFTTTDPNLVSDVWTKLLQGTAGTRTPNWGTTPYLGATRDEAAASGDWPLKLIGNANSYEDSLFRSIQPPVIGYPVPRLFNEVAPAPTHPYADDEEPMRKVWNNITTVSDAFLVVWTVGFFEVDQSATPYVVGAVPILGKELFDKVPGDFRTQYAAVVDRSAIGLSSASNTTPAPKPWETKLVADAPVGSTTITVEGTVNPVAPATATSFRILSDGAWIDVTPGSTIRLGTGDSLAVSPAIPGDGEWVTIANPPMTPPSAINAGNPGQVVLTLSGATTRFHGASSRVSNTIPGNPGPQPGLDPSLPANRHLVPYYTRLHP